MAQAKIIPATLKDIPHIRKIVDLSWPLTYGEILTPAQLHYMIGLIYSQEALLRQFREGHHFYILWEDDKARGFIDMGKREQGLVKLHKIYLVPEVQAKGYGRLLMNFAISTAKNMGADTLKLNVNRFNKALGFYERMGFTISESVDIPIGEGFYMNDYVMTRSLTD